MISPSRNEEKEVSRQKFFFKAQWGPEACEYECLNIVQNRGRI